MEVRTLNDIYRHSLASYPREEMFRTREVGRWIGVSSEDFATAVREVAHGLLSLDQSIHLYAVSHYWHPDDELPCRWDDPRLAIPWPAPAKHLSEQDVGAPGAEAVLAQLDWPPL